jgi:hypothetical protein
MPKSSNNQEKKQRIKAKDVISTWSGYNQSWVKSIIKGAMKSLQLLGALTFDAKLLFWVTGLKNHLENKIKEAEKELKEIEKYKF